MCSSDLFSSGGLVQASDGKLYGTTSNGGASNYGTIFSFDPVTLVYSKLKDFDNTNGSNPTSNLILANNGKLYGQTRDGGVASKGVIFSFDPATSLYAKLKDFDNSTGILSGALFQANDGKLYGTTRPAVANTFGILFCFDPTLSIYSRSEERRVGKECA